MDREKLDNILEWSIGLLVLLGLLFLPLAFGGRPQGPSGTFLDPLLLDPFLVAQWLCLPILGLWGLRVWVDPKPRLLFPPVCWAVLAFAGYAVFRYYTSNLEYVARQEVLRVLVYTLLFFVVVNNLHRQELTQILAFSVIAVASAIAAYAVYQFFANSDQVWHVLKPYPRRGSGTYICPNHLGGLLEMVLPLALAYTLVGRVKVVTRILLGYAALVIMAGIVVTMSRGTWLATAFALMVFFIVLLFQRSYRVPALLALALLVIGGALVFPKSYAIQARVDRIVSEGKLADDARFSLWKPALRMWQTQPWTGVGPGHFDYRFGEFRPENVQRRPDRAHNDFLNALTDWGIIGVVLLAAIGALVVVGVLKTWPHVIKAPRDLGGTSNSNKLAFVLGSGVGLLALLAHSVVDFNLHIPANALLAVSLMALLSSNLRFAASDYWLTVRIPLRLVVSVILVGGFTVIGVQSWRKTSENRWLAKAGLAEAFSFEQAGFFQRALAVEPGNFQTAALLGEVFRKQSSAGPDNYRELAENAMKAFNHSMELNPYDAGSQWRYGWCLDWLERSSESSPYFVRAEQLDGNNYFVAVHVGIHHVQVGDLATARKWFQRSLRLYNEENPVAVNYLGLVDRLMRRETERRSGLLSVPQTGTGGS